MENKLELAVDKAVHEAVNQQLLMQGAITTVLLIAGVVLLRYFLSHFVRGKSEILDKEQRRWLNHINNGTTILVLLGLILIWTPQIHTFALSLTAFAVAVVLSTKELLMCITGGFLRATTKPFDIGDWITVDDLTGEVMRITTMATVVEEIDMAGETYQFTGQTIQIPNSKFLSINVENANFIKNHVYYDIPITVQYADLDPQKLMKQLQNITTKHFAPFRDEATKFNKKVEKVAAVDFADPEPQYFLKTTDSGHFVYTVRLFVPTLKAVQIGTSITQDFLSYVYKTKIKKAA